jgi:hypothetical protein
MASDEGPRAATVGPPYEPCVDRHTPSGPRRSSCLSRPNQDVITHLLRTRLVWLAAALLSIALVAGCGGGGATDDVAKGAAKVVDGAADEAIAGAGFGDDGGRALPPLSRQLRPPASRLATPRGADVSVEEFNRLMGAAFCEGWAIYRNYGAFPSSAQWYEIAENRISAIVFPAPALVSQVAAAFEAVAYASETGDVAGAELDLYCGLR